MKLSVEQLRRNFGDVEAVKELSFSISSGEIYGFVGPNGAGKTTTMKIIATLDEPTSGDVLLDGISVVQEPEKARRAIGFMPDHLPAHRDMTVDDYLDFFARAYGLRSVRRRQIVDSICEFTRLDGIRSKLIHTLSKGMRQRLSLARALVHDPEILILDEPAAGLDPRARVELRELLLALAGQGKAILISSHILTELAEICHGAVIIEHGKMIRAGSISALLSSAHQHTLVRLRGLDGSETLHRDLLTFPRVEAVRPAGEELEVEIAGDEEAAAELLASLIRSDIRIVEFRLRRSGLEEVFMSVTQGEVQ